MIVLITPTGGRPAQFKLCAEYMRRQTYSGDVLWIIVDDCEPETTKLSKSRFKKGWNILQEYPRPAWQLGQNTQARNISAGIIKALLTIPRSEIKAIFIIEDDDYYKDIYLEKMMERLADYWLIGESHCIYYNVASRRYNTCPNNKHASLFQSAFTLDVLPIFENCYGEKYIDLAFWHLVPEKKKLLFKDGNLGIGIKGIPGRYGIGMGHRYIRTNPLDPDLAYLKSLIGPDYANYEEYYVEKPV